MMGLTFTAPMVLLGLLSLPVIWWLLRATPPQPQRTPFGGLIFLEDIEKEKETPARTPWWLLLIRLGAIAFIFLGLAGPILNADREYEGAGPLLLIVDDSWPAAPYWRERQEAVRSLSLAPGMDERPIRILTTAGEPQLSPPMSAAQATNMIDGLIPRAAMPNRAAALNLTEEVNWAETEVFWLSDGTIGRTGGDRDFLRTVSEASQVTVFRIPGEVTLALTDLAVEGPNLAVTVRRIGNSHLEGRVVATGSGGRTLAEVPFVMTVNEDTVRVPIDLPLALRNDIARFSIAGVRSAGATWLTDGGARRIRTGIVAEQASSLLDGGFYLSEALAPHAVVSNGGITELATPETGLIVLEDVGILREGDEARLLNWISQGGVLLRFAGPNTANAAGTQGATRPATFPVALRGGERAFGGALTWEDPQAIQDFTVDGPFGDLSLEEEILVRRQVLTRAGTEPGFSVWASLADGTPLVTARPEGQGLVILFHVTATPTWSDLPISGLFPQMMGRIAALAAGVTPQRPTQAMAPYRLLDGFGALNDPPASAPVASPDALAAGDALPGYYGADANVVAINTYTENSPTLDKLAGGILPASFRVRGPDGDTARAAGPPLVAIALALLALDALLLVWRRWRDGRRGLLTAGLALFMVTINLPPDAMAQDLALRPNLDTEAIEATLDVRLAYVITGNPEIDRISRAGLRGLSNEAHRRSALEPADPIGVDIERDDLSVYPLLYWPVLAGSRIPTDDALSRLESFMAGGGMLLIDTQDGERQSEVAFTPSGDTLRTILLRMNIPPLEPLPEDHILTKSFYRLEDLHGRNSGGPVWVEAESALRETTDGVPSLIIAGRDWATAWAVDEFGRPLRPAGPGGQARREFSYRSGINIAMVALTGNYKADQVHVQEMLDRLGEQP